MAFADTNPARTNVRLSVIGGAYGRGPWAWGLAVYTTIREREWIMTRKSTDGSDASAVVSASEAGSGAAMNHESAVDNRQVRWRKRNRSSWGPRFFHSGLHGERLAPAQASPLLRGPIWLCSTTGAFPSTSNLGTAVLATAFRAPWHPVHSLARSYGCRGGGATQSCSSHRCAFHISKFWHISVQYGRRCRVKSQVLKIRLALTGIPAR